MKRVLLLGLILMELSSSTTARATGNNPGGNNRRQQENPPPVASITPGSLDFGDQVTKTSSKPQRVTVTNTGAKDLYIRSAELGGDNREEFSIVKDTCTGVTVAPNKSCVVDVTFTPTAKEGRKASLVLTNNAADSPQSVILTGTGINSVSVPPSTRR